MSPVGFDLCFASAWLAGQHSSPVVLPVLLFLLDMWGLAVCDHATWYLFLFWALPRLRCVFQLFALCAVSVAYAVFHDPFLTQQLTDSPACLAICLGHLVPGAGPDECVLAHTYHSLLLLLSGYVLE